MIVIGVDYHPSWQQICWLDTETGETEERKLAVDDAAGGWSDHVDGVCADDWIPAWETCGELPGADPTGAQFGRASAIALDQQAGQPIPANAAGGSGAERRAVRP